MKKIINLLLVLGLTVFTLQGCMQNDTTEDKIEDVTEEVKDKAEDVADKAEDVVDKAEDKI